MPETLFGPHSFLTPAMPRKNLHEDGDLGWLYLIRIPPNRIKIGYTKEEDVSKRLESAYTFNPDIEILHTWVIRQHWEAPTREYMTHDIQGLNVIRRHWHKTEVFEYDPAAYATIIKKVYERASMFVSTLTHVYPTLDYQSMADSILKDANL